MSKEKKTALKVLYYLKRNQSKANGQCPVMGRITIGSSVAQFSLKVDADATLWDTKAGRMRGKSKAATECNRQIEKVNTLIHTRYAELTSRQKVVKAEEVKNAIQGNADENELLLTYCRQMNEKYALRVGVDRKPATYRLELSSYAELERFVHEKYQVEDVSFRSLTYSFIEDFNFHLRVQRKLKPNSAAKPLIFLNKAVRLAVREGIIKQNPFLSFKSDKSTATHKTLTREELDKLMNVPLHPHSKESLCRDAFVFAVFTGMAFIDVKNLTADKITIMDDGSRWISSRRVKTGSPFSVKLMDIPLTIIEKYKSKSKFVFPDMPEHHTIYGVLNRIAKKCGITHRIGFHSARHTFASLITLSEGVPIETVSSMLGHRSLRTTQIYAQLSLDTIAKDILSLARRIEGLYEWID